MTPQVPPGRRREHGAILVHVAVVLLGLVAFSALTIDFGIMMLARGQAQNAADAAAHAAAVSLAFDAPSDFDRARAAAETMGESHPIFGTAPDITRGSGDSVDETEDISFPLAASDTCPSGGTVDKCVRVNVYRTTAAYNEAGGDNLPLPAFFTRLVGRLNQGVRATATAHILSGDTTDCLKPWAVADRWDENVKRVCNGQNQVPPCQGTWQANDVFDLDQTFDRFAKVQGTWGLDPTIPSPTPGPDEYIPPTLDEEGLPIPGTGSGYELLDQNKEYKDYGQVLALKLGGGSNDVVSPGWFQSLDLDCVGEGCPNNSGLNKYQWNIKNCSGVDKTIGDTIPVQTGVGTGPTDQSVYDSKGGNDDTLAIWERDPDAYWDPGTPGDPSSMGIRDSCAPGVCADGKYYDTSPRIVPVALFDVQKYLETNPSGNGGSVTITNIMGFFIIGKEEAADLGLTTKPGNTGAEVYGVMVAVPGGAKKTTEHTSSFIQTIVLAR